MLKVTVEVMSWLKDDFGHKSTERLVFEETINQKTSIMDLVHQLAEKYPRFGRKAFSDPKQGIFDYCSVILNGSFLSAPSELDRDLKDGDKVTLSPAFYGG